MLNDGLKILTAIVTNIGKTYSFWDGVTLMKRYKNMLGRKRKWKEQTHICTIKPRFHI